MNNQLKSIIILLLVVIISVLGTIGFQKIILGKNSNDIQVGDVKITESELLDMYKNEYGTYLIDGHVYNLVWAQYGDITEDQYHKGVEFLKESSGVETLDELKEQTNLTNEDIETIVTAQVNQLEFLKEELDITEEDIELKKEENEGMVLVNTITLESEDELNAVLKKIDEGERLEDASHQEIEDYHLRYGWEVPMHDSELYANEEIEEYNESIFVKKTDDEIIVYEIQDRMMDVAPMEHEYFYVSQIASERGYDLVEKTDELMEKIVKGHEFQSGME